MKPIPLAAQVPLCYNTLVEVTLKIECQPFPFPSVLISKPEVVAISSCACKYVTSVGCLPEERRASSSLG